MLSEISQSSKRLGKLKKYKSKARDSGFDFLLQSLDRGKENQVPNHPPHPHLTANRPALAHSVHIDPLLTAPVHSFTLNHCPASGEPAFYLDNVKRLDRSDLTLSDNNNSLPSRKSKHRERSSKSRKGRREGRRNGSGRSWGEGEWEELVYKMKQYLSITDDILGEIDVSRWKFGRKARGISKELVSMITAMEGEGAKEGLSQSVKTTSFNMYSSEMLPSGTSSSPFVKRITGLEVQRQKLNSLISQHEMANIKMYIKLNDGESEEIEHCKRQLASLFDKYKLLEGLVTKEKKRMAEMAAEKKETDRKCEELTQQNTQLLGMIEKLQETLEKQQKRKKEREAVAPIRVSMLRPESHLREHSYPSFLQNSQASRGELRIQSLQNSCNESRFSSDEIVPLSSSITTSTSRANRKGGRLGINLNALLDSLTNTQAHRIADDPERLKAMMRDCKQTILRMEGVITDQNKELQLSIRALEDLQERAKARQERLAVAEKQLGRRRKENKCALNDSGSKGKRGKKEERRVEVDERGKVSIDLNFKKAKSDEYRIIAMQALAIEQAINNQRMR